jgi:hypothetical protein
MSSSVPDYPPPVTPSIPALRTQLIHLTVDLVDELAQEGNTDRLTALWELYSSTYEQLRMCRTRRWR